MPEPIDRGIPIAKSRAAKPPRAMARKKVEATPGIEPGCKDLQSSA